MNDLLCAICKEPQARRINDSIPMSCKNGHDGEATVLVCGGCGGTGYAYPRGALEDLHDMAGAGPPPVCAVCRGHKYVRLDPNGDYLKLCVVCENETVHSYDEASHGLLCDECSERRLLELVAVEQRFVMRTIRESAQEVEAAILHGAPIGARREQNEIKTSVASLDEIERGNNEALAAAMAEEMADDDEVTLQPADSVKVVPIREPPPAPSFLDEAAAKAGYAGRTHEWASLVLGREANAVLNGDPAIAGTDWKKQAEVWKARAGKLAEYCVLEVAAAILRRGGNRLTREQAVMFAHQEIEKIAGGVTERPTIIIPGKGRQP